MRYCRVSVFENATRSRYLFILSFVLNACWSLLAYNDKEMLAALAATLLWSVVLAMCLLALYERNESQVSWLSCFGNELDIRLLFASDSVTTMLS